MIPQEIIRKTRNKKELTKEEIDYLIKGISTGDIADIQAASFTMAVFLNGLTKDETLNLTLSMRDSGEIIKFKDINGPIVDKHSTGGVGDKVSLMLAPMLAACGAYVPMIAGRGLGHTGGTLDKLDSLKGYQTNVGIQLFQKTVKEAGCAIVGQTKDLAPADKKLYAIRDVCATVESIPLITASILSKKLAAGLQYLVMDIKCGNGAFMENKEEARKLASSIVNVANGANTKTTAILTDMNSVLGNTVGNVLELKEALDYLSGKTPDSRLKEVTDVLCSEILVNAKLAKDNLLAKAMLQNVIDKGYAYERFVKMSSMLGADTFILENYDTMLPKAKYVKPIYPQTAGYVSKIDTRKVGIGVIVLGGGRTTPIQQINYTTGFTSFCQIGDKVDTKTPLCYVHSENEDNIKEVIKLIQEAVSISEIRTEKESVIIEKII
ncbi:MAG: thymidine phosphorylase [Alphaproteobacteria bacterium]|nr:thymidine phosphorylase [Alphaproteobacteria bacterium]